VQLHDSKGNSSHVIGIAGRCIFDSTRHHALPLSPESLDACCLGDATVLRVSYAMRFVPGKKLLRAAVAAM